MFLEESSSLGDSVYTYTMQYKIYIYTRIYIYIQIIDYGYVDILGCCFHPVAEQGKNKERQETNKD